MTTLIIAIIAAAVAIIFANKPFDGLFHQWQFTVAAAIAGLVLFASAAMALRARHGDERFAALAGLGGGLLCAAMVSAAFSVGPPHTLGGSPAQITPLRRGASVAVRFPAVEGAGTGALSAPQAVELLNGARPPETIAVGETRSLGQYVLRVSSGPIAFVRATSLDGRPVTVTQPEGATFVSPYLLFPFMQGEQRLDYFAVPPLHRTVNVAYYPSYRDPTKGIDIPAPFVLVQIAEENGAELYRGATISGRPIRKGGVVLTFQLGTYPDVVVTSVPARLALGVGLAMIGVGVIGFLWLNLRVQRTERRRASAK